MAIEDAPPEPNPNWDGTAQDELGWLFPAHVYLFAVSFIILGMITILALVFKRNSRESKHFVKIIMLSAIILLSISRAVLLFVILYMSGGNSTIWWIFACVLIEGLGSTSLTASLAILLYITSILTRITGKCRQRQLGLVAFVVTVVNFVFFITSDFVTLVSGDKGKIMLTVCQTTFACWGLIVSGGFATLTYKLRKNANATFEQAKFDRGMKVEGKKLKRLSLLIGALSATSAVFFVLKIYEAVSGITTSEKYSDTWSWWVLKTVLRTLEIINAVVLLLVFKRSSGKIREGGKSNGTVSAMEKPTLGSISMKTITDIEETEKCMSKKKLFSRENNA
ncbi:uncharacterized protein LOC114542139 [Dendronephthya gigantea]|uniref:uncharacterized protein LOC114542139 n=1 Tax=Dendronephthya gigantea TaxID=151771 RepID=UPI00106BBF35|nr:uncharacterized protein LOC114542139 [Dendronephthya gigantea]